MKDRNGRKDEYASDDDDDKDNDDDNDDDDNDYTNNNDNDNDDDNDDDDDDDSGLQKLNDTVKKNLISEFHPEMMEHNESEIELMATVVRNSNGIIIGDLHRSIPFVIKYERARIIGERTRQINSGALPFIDVEPDIIDGYLIAVEEFNNKKIPFIVKRPLPSGKSEYWKLSDLKIM